MNNAVTSKDEILKISKNLIAKQGPKAVNIRAIASECNASVGAIYNYFPSKSELLMATIDSIWQEIFHISLSNKTTDFIEYTRQLFMCLQKGDEKYPNFFSLHSISLIGDDKQKGEVMMKNSWSHIHSQLLIALHADSNVSVQTFDDTFTEAMFIDILFSLMLSALVKKDYGFEGIAEMIRRCIYQK